MAPNHRFIADVRSARNRVDDGIDGIVVLDREAQTDNLVFTYIHEKLTDPVQIRIQPVNSAGYPEESNFLLTTVANDADPAVTAELQNLQNYTFGQPVVALLCDVSAGLGRALDPDRDGDTAMGEAADDASPDSDDEDDFDDDFADDDLEDGTFSYAKLKTRQFTSMARGVLNKIKRDLRKVREAGAKIGILGGVVENACTHLLVLSIRARKLGISDEALEAWDVDPAEYIVLLMRLDEPYPSAQKILTNPVSSFAVEFRIGKCNKSKPSEASARRAFLGEGEKANTTPREKDDRPFSKLFISNSLEQFMNEQFLAIFKLRLTGLPSWDAANAQMQDLHVLGRTPNASAAINGPDLTKVKAKGKDTASSSLPEGHDQQTFPTILTWDPFAVPPEGISTPLVALQFALHYFVRCTEYCLQCHRKVDKEFEALKPYVCSNPLCLFQYITLGFGPSIEHEIISQPYVVDLLITLCYSSLMSQSSYPSYMARTYDPQAVGPISSYSIRDFPTGLRLKVPFPPPPPVVHHQTPRISSAVTVIVDMATNSFKVLNLEDFEKLREDSWMVLRHPQDADPNGMPNQPWIHHVYIKSLDMLSISGTIEFKVQDPRMLQTSLSIGKQSMELFNYDCDLDDLDDDGKAQSMKLILDTLPPISHIREKLLRQPHSRLKHHNISSSAITLLEWIIASNRSFILQVSAVHDHHALDRDLLTTIKTRDQELIPSMDGFVQFRFATGNPDKELRFHRALKKEAKSESKYPTLFAWHGSSLQNWHSILRHGLDYNKISNGRAFGDGVYFSPNYAISTGYMGRGMNASWPKSALNPNGVMALCEIINSPDKFTSHSPHYVVSQLDWIQCRYLFIQTGVMAGNDSRIAGFNPLMPSHKPATSVTKVASAELLPQDPDRKVFGAVGELKIPRKALPSSRGMHSLAEPANPKRPLTSQDGGDTDEEDAEDLEALFSEDEPSPPPPKRFQSIRNTRDSSVDSAAARELTTQRPVTPPKSVDPSQTDFRPGALDLKSIPQLALPEWANANSSKRLAGDIKIMQKVQAKTPLHELGWYIDFENIDNMFQWIVELHTFDPALPLAQDMKKFGITSIVLELRFGKDYPFSPPFVRVIRPQFLPFMSGGGGHVTIGGAICMELLTNNGWTPSNSLETVLVSIKMAMSEVDPQPARLQQRTKTSLPDYNPYEALSAFSRFALKHGWTVPQDAMASAQQQYKA